jgi:aspartyl/asparaginyl-tRNA synthetase
MSFDMAPEHPVTNGSQLAKSHSHSGDLLITGGQLVRSHGLGDSVYFDARVHSTPVKTAHSTVTVLLRRNGEFIDTLLEPNSTDAASFDAAQGLTIESLVRVSGSILLEDQLATETDASKVATIRVSKLIVLSGAIAGIPKTTTSHGGPRDNSTLSEGRPAPIEERLNNRLLDSRVAANAAIFKLFSGVHELAVEYLSAHDFCCIPTPAFVGYEYPGDENDVFAVPYFDQTAWLTPTSEVHLGMALSADLERVYDIHTVFRREAGADGRHLAEV